MIRNDFDPVPTLEAAGIDDYQIDYQSHVIQLSWEDLIKWTQFILAGDLSKSGLAVAIMMLEEYRGWRTKTYQDSGSRK
ncbi:MAG TPA: hypothetical protein VN426_06230 [Syntrophomonadaceae bacterium]|nr:hypothetical protein [Syntrophomonadaceae bacterium]